MVGKKYGGSGESNLEMIVKQCAKNMQQSTNNVTPQVARNDDEVILTEIVYTYIRKDVSAFVD